MVLLLLTPRVVAACRLKLGKSRRLVQISCVPVWDGIGKWVVGIGADGHGTNLSTVIAYIGVWYSTETGFDNHCQPQMTPINLESLDFS